MEDNLQEKYLKMVMADFGMENKPLEEQAKVLQMATERFENVVITTMLKKLSPLQRIKFQQLLESENGAERGIAELASQVSGLDVALEDSLAKEYEIIKSLMS